MLADPFELVKTLQPGIMIYGKAKAKIEDEFTFVFLIREEDEYIERLNLSPTVQVKTGLLVYNNAAAILVMIKIKAKKYC